MHGHIAINELGIKSPLREAGFTKEEIRIMSRHFELPTWNKPFFACLASRFPYDERITREKLAMVDQGEQLLMDLGFKQFRVRIHGNVAASSCCRKTSADLWNQISVSASQIGSRRSDLLTLPWISSVTGPAV